MKNARENSSFLGTRRPREVAFNLGSWSFCLFPRFFHYLNKIIVSITLIAFIFTSVGIDFGWAARVSPEFPSVSSGEPGSSAVVKDLNVSNFSLPEYLGTVKDSWSPSVPYNLHPSPYTIIHIQDAHCNYGAQHTINDIISYLNKEYGVSMINLEGGAKDYDLSIFTTIQDLKVREQVADSFVKEGLVNGAEYFAINNPDKASLWGIEDSKLYIENLKVYRDSLSHKEEIDKSLKSLNFILSNLKAKIYSKELLSFDMQYSAYKAGNLEFKDYLNSLIDVARNKAIDIKSFANISLLSRSLEEEKAIDFKKANKERDILIDNLQKLLSKREMEEIVLKTIEFKTERISQADFYGYLLKKSKSVKVDLKDYPELQKYISYVSNYNAIDRSKLINEMERLEESVRVSMCQSVKERQLSDLSKNLAILKNIFNITLTKDDFRYYQENVDSFNISNYISFINSQALLYKITATLNDGIARLDGYREDIVKFYEYSLKRDEAFLRNVKFSQGLGSRVKGQGNQVAVIVTGGFHTENLCELFKKNNISYISIMPNFKNQDGYECPYFSLLAGETNGLQKRLYSVLAGTAMQVPSMLNKALGTEIWGRTNVDVFMASVVLTSMAKKRRLGAITDIVNDGKDNLNVKAEGDSFVISKNDLFKAISAYIDRPMEQAGKEGFKDISDDQKNAVKALALKLGERDETLREQIQQIENLFDPKYRGPEGNELHVQATHALPEGQDGHVGGYGVTVRAGLDTDKEKRQALHEIISGFVKDHRISDEITDLLIADRTEDARQRFAQADKYTIGGQVTALWQMTQEERDSFADQRDYAHTSSRHQAPEAGQAGGLKGPIEPYFLAEHREFNRDSLVKSATASSLREGDEVRIKAGNYVYIVRIISGGAIISAEKMVEGMEDVAPKKVEMGQDLLVGRLGDAFYGVKSDVNMKRLPALSRSHFSFKVEYSNGLYSVTVEDKGSTFGTEMDWKVRIDPPQLLEGFKLLFDEASNNRTTFNLKRDAALRYAKEKSINIHTADGKLDPGKLDRVIKDINVLLGKTPPAGLPAVDLLPENLEKNIEWLPKPLKGGEIHPETLVKGGSVIVRAGDSIFIIAVTDRGLLILNLLHRGETLETAPIIPQKKEYVVGRNPSAVDYLVSGDPKVSRRHFSITSVYNSADSSYELKIKDLGSEWRTKIGRLKPEESGHESLLTSQISRFAGLGRAFGGTLMSRVVDRDELIRRTNNTVEALKVEGSVGGKYTVRLNEDFYDSTIGEKTLTSYRDIVQKYVDKNPAVGKFLSDPKNAGMYLDYYALSDLQYQMAHFHASLMELEKKVAWKGRPEDFRKDPESRAVIDKRVAEAAYEQSGVFVRDYIDAAMNGRLTLEGRGKSIYRKFGLAYLRREARNVPIAEKPKQLLLADYSPSITNVVAADRATPGDWSDPNVMIIAGEGYQVEEWQENPEEPGKMLHGEKVLIARWQGRIFMFYTSRSHTAEESVDEALLVGKERSHQWRSCDKYDGHFKKHHLFKDENEKGYRDTEHFDDVPGKLNLMLDKFLYSNDANIKLLDLDSFKSRLKQFEGALEGRPGDVAMAVTGPSAPSGLGKGALLIGILQVLGIRFAPSARTKIIIEDYVSPVLEEAVMLLVLYGCGYMAYVMSRGIWVVLHRIVKEIVNEPPPGRIYPLFSWLGKHMNMRVLFGLGEDRELSKAEIDKIDKEAAVAFQRTSLPVLITVASCFIGPLVLTNLGIYIGGPVGLKPALYISGITTAIHILSNVLITLTGLSVGKAALLEAPSTVAEPEVLPNTPTAFMPAGGSVTTEKDLEPTLIRKPGKIGTRIAPAAARKELWEEMGAEKFLLTKSVHQLLQLYENNIEGGTKLFNAVVGAVAGSEILDNYMVDESAPLGEGGFGVVYKGVDKKTHSAVAIKMVNPSAPMIWKLYLLREALILKKLNGTKGVVKYHNFGLVDTSKGQQFALVMELGDQTLGKILKNRKLTGNEAQRLAVSLLETVKRLRDNKEIEICNTDIKPGNILIPKKLVGGKTVDDFDNAILIDFGLALDIRSFKEMKERGEFFPLIGVGSPTYTPPEAIDNQDYNGTTDPYGIGATLHISLTDEYRSPTDKKAPVIPPGGEQKISPELSNLVARLLENDYKKRPQSPEEALAMLQPASAPDDAPVAALAGVEAYALKEMGSDGDTGEEARGIIDAKLNGEDKEVWKLSLQKLPKVELNDPQIEDEIFNLAVHLGFIGVRVVKAPNLGNLPAMHLPIGKKVKTLYIVLNENKEVLNEESYREAAFHEVREEYWLSPENKKFMEGLKTSTGFEVRRIAHIIASAEEVTRCATRGSQELTLYHKFQLERMAKTGNKYRLLALRREYESKDRVKHVLILEKAILERAMSEKTIVNKAILWPLSKIQKYETTVYEQIGQKLHEIGWESVPSEEESNDTDNAVQEFWKAANPKAFKGSVEEVEKVTQLLANLNDMIRGNELRSGNFELSKSDTLTVLRTIINCNTYLVGIEVREGLIKAVTGFIAEQEYFLLKIGEPLGGKLYKTEADSRINTVCGNDKYAIGRADITEKVKLRIRDEEMQAQSAAIGRLLSIIDKDGKKIFINEERDLRRKIRVWKLKQVVGLTKVIEDALGEGIEPEGIKAWVGSMMNAETIIASIEHMPRPPATQRPGGAMKVPGLPSPDIDPLRAMEFERLLKELEGKRVEELGGVPEPNLQVSGTDLDPTGIVLERNMPSYFGAACHFIIKGRIVIILNKDFFDKYKGDRDKLRQEAIYHEAREAYWASLFTKNQKYSKDALRMAHIIASLEQAAKFGAVVMEKGRPVILGLSPYHSEALKAMTSSQLYKLREEYKGRRSDPIYGMALQAARNVGGKFELPPNTGVAEFRERYERKFNYEVENLISTRYRIQVDLRPERMREAEVKAAEIARAERGPGAKAEDRDFPKAWARMDFDASWNEFLDALGSNGENVDIDRACSALFRLESIIKYEGFRLTADQRDNYSIAPGRIKRAEALAAVPKPTIVAAAPAPLTDQEDQKEFDGLLSEFFAALRAPGAPDIEKAKEILGELKSIPNDRLTEEQQGLLENASELIGYSGVAAPAPASAVQDPQSRISQLCDGLKELADRYPGVPTKQSDLSQMHQSIAEIADILQKNGNIVLSEEQFKIVAETRVGQVTAPENDNMVKIINPTFERALSLSADKFQAMLGIFVKAKTTDKQSSVAFQISGRWSFATLVKSWLVEPTGRKDRFNKLLELIKFEDENMDRAIGEAVRDHPELAQVAFEHFGVADANRKGMARAPQSKDATQLKPVKGEGKIDPSSPFHNVLFYEDKLANLLKFLTVCRLIYPYDLYSDSELSPLDYALKNGIYFPLDPTARDSEEKIYVAPITESFRRFILFTMKDGKPAQRIEIKIPGLLEKKREVSEEGYTISETLRERYGDEVCPEPLALIEFNRLALDLYGRQIDFSKEKPARVMVYSYNQNVDGKRLRNFFDVLKSKKAVASIENIKALFEKCCKRLAQLHALRIVMRQDMTLENFRVTVDEKGGFDVIFVGDFEDAKSIPEEGDIDKAKRTEIAEIFGELWRYYFLAVSPNGGLFPVYPDSFSTIDLVFDVFKGIYDAELKRARDAARAASAPAVAPAPATPATLYTLKGYMHPGILNNIRKQIGATSSMQSLEAAEKLQEILKSNTHPLVVAAIIEQLGLRSDDFKRDKKANDKVVGILQDLIVSLKDNSLAVEAGKILKEKYGVASPAAPAPAAVPAPAAQATPRTPAMVQFHIGIGGINKASVTAEALTALNNTLVQLKVLRDIGRATDSEVKDLVGDLLGAFLAKVHQIDVQNGIIQEAVAIEEVHPYNGRAARQAAYTVIHEAMAGIRLTFPDLVPVIVDRMLKGYPGSFNLGAGPADISMDLAAGWKGSNRIIQLFRNKENVGRMLELLTLIRMLFPYDEAQDLGDFPLKRGLDKGLEFEIAPGIFVSPATHSFRRHVIYEKDVGLNPINIVEVKIPGDLPTRLVVDRNGFDVAARLSERFGPESVVVAPAFVVETTGEFLAYGRRVKFSHDNPLRIVAFGLQDGLRISENFGNPETGERARAAMLEGLSPEEAAAANYTIAKNVLKAVKAVHRAGYVGTHDGKGSPDIRSVVYDRYHEERFTAKGLDVGELIRKNIVRREKNGERVLAFDDDLNVEFLKLETRDIDKVTKFLQSYYPTEDLKKIEKLAEIMRQGPEEVIGDMHLGNFKIVKLNNELQVLSVSDTEAYVNVGEWAAKAGLSDGAAREILARVARFEEAEIVDGLKSCGFTLSDEDFEKAGRDAEEELDRLEAANRGVEAAAVGAPAPSAAPAAQLGVSAPMPIANGRIRHLNTYSNRHSLEDMYIIRSPDLIDINTKTIVDFGCGFPAVTVFDLARKLRDAGRGDIMVKGVDIDVPESMVTMRAADALRVLPESMRKERGAIRGFPDSIEFMVFYDAVGDVLDVAVHETINDAEGKTMERYYSIALDVGHKMVADAVKAAAAEMRRRDPKVALSLSDIIKKEADIAQSVQLIQSTGEFDITGIVGKGTVDLIKVMNVFKFTKKGTPEEDERQTHITSLGQALRTGGKIVVGYNTGIPGLKGKIEIYIKKEDGTMKPYGGTVTTDQMEQELAAPAPVPAPAVEAAQPLVSEDEKGRTVVGVGKPEVKFADHMESLEKSEHRVYEQRGDIRELENMETMVIVVKDDEARLGETLGIAGRNGNSEIKATNQAMELISKSRRNTKIKYVNNIIKAKEEIAEQIERCKKEGKPFAFNTLIFVEKTIKDKEGDEYGKLAKEYFVCDLNIPDDSICSMTPLAFGLWADKFFDVVKRAESGDVDLNTTKSLAVLTLTAMGEDVNDENINMVNEALQKFFVFKGALPSRAEILKKFSGNFAITLPKIAPHDWAAFNKRFSSLLQIYTSL